MSVTQIVTPKTKGELAAAYECSAKTISRMCKEIDILTKKRLNTIQVKKFYEEYGVPFLEYTFK